VERHDHEDMAEARPQASPSPEGGEGDVVEGGGAGGTAVPKLAPFDKYLTTNNLLTPLPHEWHQSTITESAAMASGLISSIDRWPFCRSGLSLTVLEALPAGSVRLSETNSFESC
jgi:hypothetical protein